MAPGAPAQESTGTSDFKPIMGGRFVQETSKGMFMGQPFEGMGVTGYDNVKKKYVENWVDSMGTMMEQLEGTADASGKNITMTSEIIDPMSGKKVKHRAIMHLDSDTKRTFEMFGPPPGGGKEYKMMEITYTKK
jgi:hypothetical protein